MKINRIRNSKGQISQYCTWFSEIREVELQARVNKAQKLYAHAYYNWRNQKAIAGARLRFEEAKNRLWAFVLQETIQEDPKLKG